jgi:hypothetical protein
MFTESHKSDKSFNHTWENKVENEGQERSELLALFPVESVRGYSKDIKQPVLNCLKLLPRHRQTLADLFQEMERISEELGDAETGDEMRSSHIVLIGCGTKMNLGSEISLMNMASQSPNLIEVKEERYARKKTFFNGVDWKPFDNEDESGGFPKVL